MSLKLTKYNGKRIWLVNSATLKKISFLQRDLNGNTLAHTKKQFHKSLRRVPHMRKATLQKVHKPFQDRAA